MSGETNGRADGETEAWRSRRSNLISKCGYWFPSSSQSTKPDPCCEDFPSAGVLTGSGTANPAASQRCKGTVLPDPFLQHRRALKHAACTHLSGLTRPHPFTPAIPSNVRPLWDQAALAVHTETPCGVVGDSFTISSHAQHAPDIKHAVF